ncbi:GLPGLI family protein [Algoriphagus sp. CAU 1675]|nr:GLPGLI family protein [Algoriphagus sp. CAU 1675]MDF2157523.1 GLPGLI family protein [Algoriphagus sp. CAU 1675]
MKFSFVFLFLGFFLTLRSAAQVANMAVYYEVEFVTDSLNPSEKGNDLMVLWLGENYSVFQSYFAFQRDSIIKVSSSGAPTQGNIASVMGRVNAVRSPSFKYSIHKNFKENQITVFESLFFDNYKYDQPLGPLPWEIQAETKTILGYKAQKAVLTYSGRNYTAWFSEEIPLNDGPYVFNGLPGLILEIHDSQVHYSFIIKGIEKRNQSMEDLTLKNPIALSKSAYYKAKLEMYRDVTKALIGKPQANVSSQNIQQVQARYDKANNPLEKKVN